MKTWKSLSCFFAFFLILSFLFPVRLIAKERYSNFLKGLYAEKKGDYQTAYQQYSKAQLDSADSYILFKKALVMIKLNKFKEAAEELKKVKQRDPNNLDASLTLVFIYYYLNDQEKLDEEYEDLLTRAHQLNPDNTRIAEYLAQFYFYKGNIPKAIGIYQKIIKGHPSANAYFWLGTLYEENGRRKEAIQQWKKAIEIDPRHADALNSLGYVYAEEGINLDEAEALIKKALDIDPVNGAYLDSLGWVYYKKAKYKKARFYLEEAVKIIKKDPTINEHLGDTYLKLRDKEKAVLFWGKALKEDPKNEQLKKKIDKYGPGKN